MFWWIPGTLPCASTWIRPPGSARMRVERTLDSVLRRYPRLQKIRDRDGLRVRPRLAWDRGRAATRIAAELAPPGTGRFPLYAGTHPADEAAFQALSDKGLTFVVGAVESATAAHYRLQHPNQLESLLFRLLDPSSRDRGRGLRQRC